MILFFAMSKSRSVHQVVLCFVTMGKHSSEELGKDCHVEGNDRFLLHCSSAQPSPVQSRRSQGGKSERMEIPTEFSPQKQDKC